MRLLAVLLTALVLAACGSASGSADTAFVAGDGSVVLLDAAHRPPAPDLTGPTLDGGQFRLSDYRGKVVVLNVWASWCAPCRAEAPVLQSAWSAYVDDSAPVQFVGLDTRDAQAAAQAFIDRYGITYPSVIDTDGQLQLLFADTLPPQAIPSTLIIDQQGRVAARILGSVTEATLTGLVDALLDESP